MIALLVTVSYASTNPGDSSTPLGVVPKGRSKGAAQPSSTEQTVTPTGTAIPEMPQELADAPHPQETETAAHVALGESETGRGRKTARKPPPVFAMPAMTDVIG